MARSIYDFLVLEGPQHAHRIHNHFSPDGKHDSKVFRGVVDGRNMGMIGRLAVEGSSSREEALYYAVHEPGKDYEWDRPFPPSPSTLPVAVETDELMVHERIIQE